MMNSPVYAAAKSEGVLFKGFVNNVLRLDRLQNSPYDLFIDCPKKEVKIKLKLSKWRFFWLDKVRGWPVEYEQDTKRYKAALEAIARLKVNEQIMFTAGGSSLHKINECEFEAISLDVVKLKNRLELITYISY